MAKETVTRTKKTGVTDDGTLVDKESRNVDTEVDPNTTAQNVVWFVLGFIESLLALRFVFKLFGANSASGFVDFTYSITNILTAPFDFIFGVTTTNTGSTHSVFEPSILVAALVYYMIAWGIVKLITINRKTY